MKQNGDYFIVHVFCVAAGIGVGILSYIIYEYMPTQRTALLIAGALLAVLTLLYGVRRNCQKANEQALLKMIQALEEGKEGNIAFKSREEDTLLVKNLYNGIETLRQTLRKREVLQTAAMDITNSMALNLDFYKLIHVLMSRLVEEMDANWGVFYVYYEHTERLELKKTLGLSKKVYQEFDVQLGEGLIGMAAQSGKIEIYDHIPADTVFENRTFLGDITPKNILAVPVKSQDRLVAVLAFGSIYDFTPEQLQLMKLLQDPMGFAIANSLAYEKTQDLSKELQMQNQLIQSMNEKMTLRMAMQENGESLDRD